MQIPKSLILCAAICICPLLSKADTEAQARAREELRRKMAELDAAAATNGVIPATQTKPLPVTLTPAPVPTVKSATATATAVMTITLTAKQRLDLETRRIAEEKLRKKIRDLEAQSAPPK